MSNVEAAEEQEKVWLGLLLAAIAGGVDALGFLVLLGVFTSHLTGSSTHASIDLSQGHWSALLQTAFPIPLFVFGVMLGAALTQAGIRHRRPRTLSLVLLLEAALLLGCLLYGASLTRNGRLDVPVGWRYYLLLALPAVAMGMQNVSVRRASGRAIHTTYITGALTSAAESAVLYLFWLADQTRSDGRQGLRRALRTSRQQRPFDQLVFHSALWMAYVLGALFAGVLERCWQVRAFALPLAGLAAAVIWSLCRPIDGLPPSLGENDATQR